MVEGYTQQQMCAEIAVKHGVDVVCIMNVYR